MATTSPTGSTSAPTRPPASWSIRTAAPRTVTATESRMGSTGARTLRTEPRWMRLGCPGDEDGDGVLDGLDRCPRTPDRRSGATQRVHGGTGAGQPAPSVAPAPADTTAKRPRPGVRNPPTRAQPPAPTQSQAPPAQGPAPTPRKAPTGAVGTIAAGVIPGVGFAPGTARLTQASYVALDSIAQILIADPTTAVEVSAHTDNSISQAEAMRLTGLQADAVRDYLVTKGVPYQQVTSKGYGSTASPDA